MEGAAAIEACTRGVRVRAHAYYVAERSRPESSLWLFAYQVQIRNESAETVQLLARHWIVRDGTGYEEEFRGSGVVGEQPVLQPGDEFEYSSQCSLSTPLGWLRGSYTMETESGERFEAEIPRFELIRRGSIH